MIRRLLRALAAGLVLCSLASGAPAATEAERVLALAKELRCPVCQNQNLADSNAPLALDLRREIARQVAAGRSDAQVRAFMVERYGDYVLYEPPVGWHTSLLWAAPALLLGLFAALAVRGHAARAASARSHGPRR